jgi:hypothetical protein
MRTAPGSPPLPTACRSAACDSGRAPRWHPDPRQPPPRRLSRPPPATPGDDLRRRRRSRAARRRSGRRRARGCLLQEAAAPPLLAATACNGGHLPGDGLQRRPVTNGADPGAGGLVRPRRSSEVLGGAGIRDSRPGGARFAPADLADILLDSRPRRPPPSIRGRDRPPPGRREAASFPGSLLRLWLGFGRPPLDPNARGMAGAQLPRRLREGCALPCCIMQMQHGSLLETVSTIHPAMPHGTGAHRILHIQHLAGLHVLCVRCLE